MSIKTARLGPGKLTFTPKGQTSGVQDISHQVRSARIAFSVDNGETLEVLSGLKLPGEQTVSSTLEFTMFQAHSATTDFIPWSWANKGKEFDFLFTPNTVTKGTVKGTVVMAPVGLGGDVGQRNTSDVSLAIVDDPTFSLT